MHSQAPPAPALRHLAALLDEAGLDLKKSLGQNFLVNHGMLDKIADAIGAGPHSFVLEIGPGLGNLSERLAHRAGQVLSVEIDQRFRPIHEKELRKLPNLRFVYGDFLDQDLDALLPHPPPHDLRLAGNIPYHLTSPILFKIAAAPRRFACIALLMQREVAQRVVADAGSKQYGILAAKLALDFQSRIAFSVSPGSFLPPPKVVSALLLLEPRDTGSLLENDSERRDMHAFIDAAFCQRRKMLPKSLEAGSAGRLPRQTTRQALTELGHDPAARPESLPPRALLDLFRHLGRPELPARRDHGGRP